MPDPVLREAQAAVGRGASTEWIDGLLKFFSDAGASPEQIAEALRQVRWTHPSGERH